MSSPRKVMINAQIAAALIAQMSEEDKAKIRAGDGKTIKVSREAIRDVVQQVKKQKFSTGTLRRTRAKVGRNEPCPCGSKLKFKRCHGGGK